MNKSRHNDYFTKAMEISDKRHGGNVNSNANWNGNQNANKHVNAHAAGHENENAHANSNAATATNLTKKHQTYRKNL